MNLRPWGRAALGQWASPACAPRFRALLAGTLLLVAGSPARAAEGESLEYAVKATYLYKFRPFVEWPAGAFDDTGGTVNLCVAGDDPFGETLDRALSGQRFGEQAVALRRLRRVGPDTDCHMLYVAGSTSQSIDEALAAVRGQPVLTVTDSARDARAKGIIHFVIDNNRVRFEIDNGAAQESRLTISSKLLSLAVAVRRRS